MNFFDAYDVARAPTPQPSNNDQPGLNEEVTQVIGQLGRFWGGFKRQSQQALEVARKDLGDVVLQAQKEIGKLTAAEDPQPTTNAGQVTRSAGSTTPDTEDDSPSSSATLERPASDTTPSASTSSQSLFSRLQSSIPPNLINTVQSHIPESIKHASENIDISHIGSNFLTEFQRVQGITRTQAEEYARKSEALIREAVKEANEVLKDAVKITPPDPAEGAEQQSGSSSGLIWDGSDMWMLPAEQTPALSSSNAKEKPTAEAGDQPVENQHAVASRALALLRRLQSDPSIIQHNPEADEGVRDLYKTWREGEIESKSGIENPEWKGEIEKLLKEEASLAELHASLVPSPLSSEDFWSRYFFRVYQIKHEEERRKALIQATVAESDEDFSWEDDDDDNATSSHPQPTTETKLSVDSASSLVVRSVSPSVDSADSFDVVSSTIASPAAPFEKTGAPERQTNDDDDDEDEDEDDSDEDEEDEGDEDSDDSDWE